MTLCIDADKAFFTADTHFFHEAMVARRGFKTKTEMNDALISKWNAVVPQGATVFHLGDLSFGNAVDTVGVVGQLNGLLILVKGNHDKKLKSAVSSLFVSTHDLLEIDVREGPCTKQRITLCHFAMRVWNRSHYGAWQLHGHSHGSLQAIGKQMDVGIDTFAKQAPIPYEQVKTWMSRAPISIVDHHTPKSGA
jgi:calcineurin-like phosphoesterase family protein